MGMFQNANPPNLPVPAEKFDAGYVNQLLNVLRLWFNLQNSVQVLNLSGLNLDLATLPTEAALATLRSGDVYRDTTAGNVLKIKV